MTTLEPLPPSDLLPMELPLMQSAGASRARTLAYRALAQESRMAPVAGFGQKYVGLLANYDPRSSSWKTSQHSLAGGLTAFSETWPRSGTMRNGIAYQLAPLVRLTDATASGLWPTPCKVEPKMSPERWMERRAEKAAQGINLHFKLSMAAQCGRRNQTQLQGNERAIGIIAKYADFGSASWWPAEPDVGRVANGVPNQSHRLAALGNAVVPQIPELIGRAIMARDALDD